MKNSKNKIIVIILLIALVLCFMLVPVFSAIFVDAYKVSIFLQSTFQILLGVCFFPFTEIILFTHKLE